MAGVRVGPPCLLAAFGDFVGRGARAPRRQGGALLPRGCWKPVLPRGTPARPRTPDTISGARGTATAGRRPVRRREPRGGAGRTERRPEGRALRPPASGAGRAVVGAPLPDGVPAVQSASVFSVSPERAAAAAAGRNGSRVQGEPEAGADSRRGVGGFVFSGAVTVPGPPFPCWKTWGWLRGWGDARLAVPAASMSGPPRPEPPAAGLEAGAQRTPGVG